MRIRNLAAVAERGRGESAKFSESRRTDGDFRGRAGHP
jgi:hypothetical protein